MTTSLSPELAAVLRALGAITGFKAANKFRTRGGMLYIGDFGSVELRVVQTAPGYEVSIVLEKLKASIGFRVCIGAAMRNYGLIAEHRLKATQADVLFFTLPDGFYAPEFIEAFSSEPAARNLAAVNAVGWPMVLTSQQIEVIVPVTATEEGIASCMKSVLELATHTPFAKR
jgi:hypothetical protein